MPVLTTDIEGKKKEEVPTEINGSTNIFKSMSQKKVCPSLLSF